LGQICVGVPINTARLAWRWDGVSQGLSCSTSESGPHIPSLLPRRADAKCLGIHNGVGGVLGFIPTCTYDLMWVNLAVKGDPWQNGSPSVGHESVELESSDLSLSTIAYDHFHSPDCVHSKSLGIPSDAPFVFLGHRDALAPRLPGPATRTSVSHVRRRSERLVFSISRWARFASGTIEFSDRF
jgi:hypothetical protein